LEKSLTLHANNAFAKDSLLFRLDHSNVECIGLLGEKILTLNHGSRLASSQSKLFKMQTHIGITSNKPSLKMQEMFLLWI
jgi:hypothetical protein